jgi:hypothetical protein
MICGLQGSKLDFRLVTDSVRGIFAVISQCSRPHYCVIDAIAKNSSKYCLLVCLCDVEQRYWRPVNHCDRITDLVFTGFHSRDFNDKRGIPRLGMGVDERRRRGRYSPVPTTAGFCVVLVCGDGTRSIAEFIESKFVKRF